MVGVCAAPDFALAYHHNQSNALHGCLNGSPNATGGCASHHEQRGGVYTMLSPCKLLA